MTFGYSHYPEGGVASACGRPPCIKVLQFRTSLNDKSVGAAGRGCVGRVEKKNPQELGQAAFLNIFLVRARARTDNRTRADGFCACLAIGLLYHKSN
jgi:hypothetical protein